jgi:hypothetical protein
MSEDNSGRGKGPKREVQQRGFVLKVALNLNSPWSEVHVESGPTRFDQLVNRRTSPVPLCSRALVKDGSSDAALYSYSELHTGTLFVCRCRESADSGFFNETYVHGGRGFDASPRQTLGVRRR